MATVSLENSDQISEEFQYSEEDPFSMYNCLRIQISSVLIFPKRFEFAKLVNWVCRTRESYKAYRSEIQEGQEVFVLMFRERVFYCVILASSDVEFGINLNHFFTDYKFLNSRNLILLIGSAGSRNVDDLFKFYYVSEATKIDRGEIIKMSRGTYSVKMNRGKKVSRKPTFIVSERVLPNRQACCSNHLFRCVITDQEEKLYDMETFEAFSVLSSIPGVRDYGCVRFVSDIIVNDETKEATAERYKLLDDGRFPEVMKTVRKRCKLDFDFLVDMTKPCMTKLTFMNSDSKRETYKRKAEDDVGSASKRKR